MLLRYKFTIEMAVCSICKAVYGNTNKAVQLLVLCP